MVQVCGLEGLGEGIKGMQFVVWGDVGTVEDINEGLTELSMPQAISAEQGLLVAVDSLHL